MRRDFYGLFRLAAAALVTLLPLSTEIAGSGPDQQFLTVDPPGSVDTRPFGITDSGDVVGLYITTDTKVHGFLFTRGVYTSIDVPGAIRTNALGVTELQSPSDDEQVPGAGRGLAVVGRYDTANGVAHGYVLRDGAFATIDYPYPAGYAGTRFTVATGINPRGDIVGRYQGTDGLFHGFTLIDGEFTTIDHPEGRAIHALAINHRGDLAGCSYRDAPATMPCGCDGQRGFVYKQGAFTTVDVPGAISTGLTGVNRRGDIVGNYQDAAGRRRGLVLLAGNGK